MTTVGSPSAPQKPRLLDRVRLAMRAHHPAVRDPRTEAVRQQHQRDLSNGHGWVALPGGLERKYPNAGRGWTWQWVFPATSCYVDRETGKQRRHHLHESVVQRAVKESVRRAGTSKPATPHLSAVTPAQAGTFRHAGVYPAACGTTHPAFRGTGCDLSACSAQAGIRTVQELLGHKDVSTTMIYTHVLNRGLAAARSTADGLAIPHTPPPHPLLATSRPQWAAHACSLSQ